MIPANVALPLVMQVYLDSSVDGGFVNTFAKAFKQEPEDVRNQRIEDMKQELAEYIDSDGNLTVYRGSFERPFGREDDASRVIEKGFASAWTGKWRKTMPLAGSLKQRRFMK
mgnify:CR=1 FL=1